MKTTVELPDEILRQAREQASREGLDLEQFISKAIINILTSERCVTPAPRRASPVSLPLIKSKGKGTLKLGDEVMAALELHDDFTKYAASLRR
jgi:hypothetical protein